MSRRGPLIAAIVSGVVVVPLMMLLVLPKMGEVGDAKKAVDAAKNDEISLQAQLGVLQEAEAQAPETQKEIAKLDRQVPTTVDLPGLFRLLQIAADRSAVDFFQFTPGVPAPDVAGTFSMISSSITVNGGYFAIEEFLFRLETLPRAAKVMSVNITSAGSSDTGGGTTSSTTLPGSLNLQIVVEFYTTDTSAGPGSLPGPTAGLGSTITVPRSHRPDGRPDDPRRDLESRRCNSPPRQEDAHGPRRCRRRGGPLPVPVRAEGGWRRGGCRSDGCNRRWCLHAHRVAPPCRLPPRPARRCRPWSWPAPVTRSRSHRVSETASSTPSGSVSPSAGDRDATHDASDLASSDDTAP